jgi:hypothetical protein
MAGTLTLAASPSGGDGRIFGRRLRHQLGRTGRHDLFLRSASTPRW